MGRVRRAHGLVAPPAPRTDRTLALVERRREAGALLFANDRAKFSASTCSHRPNHPVSATGAHGRRCAARPRSMEPEQALKR
ncbi:hypothetical protein EMIT0158MI4_130047 [Burkholderia ambifaria]